MHLKMGANSRTLMVAAALSLVAFAGIMAVLPSHAQSTTPNASTTSSSSANSSQSMTTTGHNCPNMPGGNHSSSSKNGTAG